MPQAGGGGGGTVFGKRLNIWHLHIDTLRLLTHYFFMINKGRKKEDNLLNIIYHKAKDKGTPNTNF